VNDAKTCARCSGSLSERDQFCPSCGSPNLAIPVNWFDRLCAAIIDASVLMLSGSLLIWLGLKWWVVFVTWIVLIEIGYQLRGSLGKRFVGTSVPAKNRVQHYLRETIGKLASLSIFGIGFLMIFSREHRALHDYMAKTEVVRIGRAARVRQTFVSLLLLASLIAGAFLLSDVHINRLSSWGKSNEITASTSVVDKMPAVATIYVYDNRGKLFGQGSGFLISGDGVGVTNFHVIADAYSADVKLGDGRLYQMLSVHAYDEARDIAIFQIGRKTGLGIEQTRDLPYLNFATEDVHTGDRITAVGSPEGLSNSISDGLVSAIRSDDADRFIQITAPISPGSSGGPVFNLKGEVVAITSFQFTKGQNLNFAIPIDEVSKISAQRADLPLGDFYGATHRSNDLATAGRAELSDSQRNATSSVASAGLTGMFSGTVHNLTADLTATTVILVEEDEGNVQGCFGVMAPLYGSGPLQGRVNSNDVQFDVNGPIYSLHFEGRRSGKTLSGTYTASANGGNEQRGEFVLEQNDSKKYLHKFNPETDCPSDTEMNH
jgi:S1-C subfamily serine protease/RNA polymerase subunit RPABC4/transcription elongation factor Spt4